MHHARRSFLKRSVLGFGFLAGLWVNLGIDFKSYIIVFFKEGLTVLDAGPTLWSVALFLFWFIPLVTTMYSLYRSFLWGRIPGLITVCFAFMGGLFMPHTLGIIFAALALAMALIIPVRAA